ncbi:hypothetical protein ADM96_11910 [Burkholderia sp. ST111]|nr:hypothetical protein ADM96_11910 [Burkholderia sp. ST111]
MILIVFDDVQKVSDMQGFLLHRASLQPTLGGYASNGSCAEKQIFLTCRYRARRPRRFKGGLK